MIGSFADQDAAEIFDTGRSRRYAGLCSVIQRKILALDAATVLHHLMVPPGNRLEALKADRAGQQSIRINQRFRLCFRWEGRQAYEIEIVDYR